METNTTIINESMSNKIWKLLRVALVMVKKGFTKSKLLLDFALLLKRSHKLAGKTLHSLAAHDAAHDYHLSRRSSPAFPFLRKRGKLASKERHSGDEAVTMAAVQRVLEMINARGEAASPGSPGQLRITDSPFPLKEGREEAVHVNKAAEDFITRFYSNLRMEKSTAVDTPYHDAWDSLMSSPVPVPVPGP